MRIEINLECDTEAFYGERKSKLEETAFVFATLADHLSVQAESNTNPFPGAGCHSAEFLEDSQGNECGQIFYIGECNDGY